MTRQLNTEQDIEEVFEYASKEILNGYMFMHKANGYLYFKHTVTTVSYTHLTLPTSG